MIVRLAEAGEAACFKSWRILSLDDIFESLQAGMHGYERSDAMEKGQEKYIYRKFIISVSLASVLCLSVIFSIVSVTNRKLIFEQARTEAREIFNSIVITRKWNAGYGGVYVEKKPGIEFPLSRSDRISR